MRATCASALQAQPFLDWLREADEESEEESEEEEDEEEE